MKLESAPFFRGVYHDSEKGRSQMSENKNLLIVLGEWWERRRTIAPEEAKLQHLGRIRRTLRWFAPNGGTLLLVGILILTANVWAKPLTGPAAAPGPSATTVNYQGRLADPSGNPKNGTFGMTFALYDASTGGSLVWGPESHAAVPVSDGLFSVGLGSQTSGGIPTNTWNGDRYLEITVGGETLSPRELIRSVPIAGMALTVPDGAVKSRNTAPTVFEAYTSGEVVIGSDSNPTEILSLDVDFPIAGTYLISVRVSTRHDQGGRVVSHLQDEAGTVISGSSIHTRHDTAGNNGTHTGSVTTVCNFGPGPHTIRLFSGATGGGGTGAVRSAHIVAIPFAQP
jgi:hypothetical protein